MSSGLDVIVVGSGASGVHASHPLVDAGLQVLMLDVGKRDTTYAPLVPADGFTRIRRGDPGQHRYLLGDRFEGIPFRGIGAAAQLTPPRQHVIDDADRLLPIECDGFQGVESLALGGLASAWGGVVVPFSQSDLASWPIARRELEPHYATVAERIGVSGADDDLERYVGKPGYSLLPPAELDSNAEVILERYTRKRAKLNNAGFTMGQAWLAVATQRHRGRGPLQYRDMEFWGDGEGAVYRPQYGLDELRSRATFQYRPDMLVRVFEQRDDGRVDVVAQNQSNGRLERLSGRRVVLAAGTLGSTRIILRSVGCYCARVPIVCNPYVYLACLNWRLVGKPVRDRRHSLCQLIVFVDLNGEGSDVLQTQLYSYRSLLTFRLVKESPLAYPESIRLMRMIQPYLVTINVYHSDRPRPENYAELRRELNEAGDRLHVHCRISEDLARRHLGEERRVARLFRRVGCWPLKVVRPVHGASIHYGGCIPMTRDAQPLTTDPSGRLRDAPDVYVADGAVFPDLPAKGLTFTLMANANRLGVHLRDELLRVESRQAHSVS